MYIALASQKQCLCLTSCLCVSLQAHFTPTWRRRGTGCRMLTANRSVSETRRSTSNWYFTVTNVNIIPFEGSQTWDYEGVILQWFVIRKSINLFVFSSALWMIKLSHIFSKYLKYNSYLLFCAGCALCRLSDDDPAMFGEKVTLKEHKLSVHYFCLVSLWVCVLILMYCRVYDVKDVELSSFLC